MLFMFVRGLKAGGFDTVQVSAAEPERVDPP